MSQTPAGWHPQPDGRQRYWDGQRWTGQFAPAHPGSSAVEQPAVTQAAKPNHAWYTTGTPVSAESFGAGQAGRCREVTGCKACGKPSKAAPVKPATPKVGATVRDGKFAFTVRSVKCGLAKVGTNPYLQEKAQGQFCALALTVKNIGDEPQSMFADNQYAFDSKGRKYSANSMASMADESSQVLWEEINPGNSVKGTVYFDMPKAAKLAKLELHDSMFSGGVTVTTR